MYQPRGRRPPGPASRGGDAVIGRGAETEDTAVVRIRQYKQCKREYSTVVCVSVYRRCAGIHVVDSAIVLTARALAPPPPPGWPGGRLPQPQPPPRRRRRRSATSSSLAAPCTLRCRLRGAVRRAPPVAVPRASPRSSPVTFGFSHHLSCHTTLKKKGVLVHKALTGFSWICLDLTGFSWTYLINSLMVVCAIVRE